MEERAPRAGGLNNINHDVNPPMSKPSDDQNLIYPLPPPPAIQTYIVQIPRNNVYRIPPPENSKIVESYKQPDTKTNGHKCCLWLFITIIILASTIAMTFGIIHMVYKTKLPKFAIKNFSVNQPPNSHAKPGYAITLDVDNPNERMGISYGGNGYGILSFNHHKVADGKFSSFSQEAMNSKSLHLVLKGVTLPSEMENSMNSTRTKKRVSLRFKIYVNAKISSWTKTWKNDIEVSCDFKVNTLAADTKVVLQKCSTQVQ